MGIPEALGLRYNQRTFSKSTTLPSLGTLEAGWSRRPHAPSSTAGLAGTLEMPDNEEACQRGTSTVPLQRPHCFLTKSTSTKHCCFVFLRVRLQRSWLRVRQGGAPPPENVTHPCIYFHTHLEWLDRWIILHNAHADMCVFRSDSGGRPDGGAVSIVKCRVQ